MAHRLIYNTLARADLLNLYAYIEERNGPAIAGGYLDRIEALCASLDTMPERGVDRSALGRGLRTVALERRVQVVYSVSPDTVEVLRVLYGGRDFGSDDLPN